MAKRDPLEETSKAFMNPPGIIYWGLPSVIPFGVPSKLK
jgi:hypothetical protein